MQLIFFIVSILFILNKGFFKNSIADNSLKKWVIEKNSSLNIQGETNISNFQCDVTEYLKPDTLAYVKNETTKELSFTNSCLTIDVRQFDCHNRFITNNFRSALKADEDPKLKIIFLTISQLPNSCNNQVVKGMVDIELAHVIKRTEINYKVTVLPGNHFQLNGSHIFSFSDFNLKAPRSIAGLICTKDQVRVNFQLFFQAI
jgi:hypothetical protein